MALSIKLVDSSDPAAIEAYCQVVAAVREHDVPKWRESTPRMVQLMIEVPFPGTAHEFYLVARDGEPVGRVLLEIPMLENLDMLVPDIWVVPSARRQGIGRELFDWVKAQAGTRQRKRLICTTLWEQPGIPAPNLAGAAFAEALGFRSALADVTRRLDLSTVDESALDEMLASAKAKSEGYRVVTWSGPPPEEYVDDLAYLDSRLVTDAPTGELEFEAPKPDAQRIRDIQAAAAARERIAYHSAAVHEESNRLVAWTMITKELSLDWNAFQQITIVEPEHRGHRLGALVKVENLRHFRAKEPTVTAIDTFNANDNSYMIAINEQMGFRPLYAWQNWQREI